MVRCATLLLACGLFALGGCERDEMHNQGKKEPYEPSDFFADGQSSRPLVAGTVSRDQRFRSDPMVNTSFDLTAPDTYPFEVTRDVLRRGQERYNIYCIVCHGAAGNADGMIVQRGFSKPPSFITEERLRNAPAGYFVNVMTHGFGAMYSYADRIKPEDRWAIAAYIRVLQLSQRADVNQLPEEDRNQAASALTAAAQQTSAGQQHSSGQQNSTSAAPGSHAPANVPGNAQ